MKIFRNIFLIFLFFLSCSFTIYPKFSLPRLNSQECMGGYKPPSGRNKNNSKNDNRHRVSVEDKLGPIQSQGAYGNCWSYQLSGLVGARLCEEDPSLCGKHLSPTDAARFNWSQLMTELGGNSFNLRESIHKLSDPNSGGICEEKYAKQLRSCNFRLVNFTRSLIPKISDKKLDQMAYFQFLKTKAGEEKSFKSRVQRKKPFMNQFQCDQSDMDFAIMEAIKEEMKTCTDSRLVQQRKRLQKLLIGARGKRKDADQKSRKGKYKTFKREYKAALNEVNEEEANFQQMPALLNQEKILGQKLFDILPSKLSSFLSGSNPFGALLEHSHEDQGPQLKRILLKEAFGLAKEGKLGKKPNQKKFKSRLIKRFKKLLTQGPLKDSLVEESYLDDLLKKPIIPWLNRKMHILFFQNPPKHDYGRAAAEFAKEIDEFSSLRKDLKISKLSRGLRKNLKLHEKKLREFHQHILDNAGDNPDFYFDLMDAQWSESKHTTGIKDSIQTYKVGLKDHLHTPEKKLFIGKDCEDNRLKLQKRYTLKETSFGTPDKDDLRGNKLKNLMLKRIAPLQESIIQEKSVVGLDVCADRFVKSTKKGLSKVKAKDFCGVTNGVTPDHDILAYAVQWNGAIGRCEICTRNSWGKHYTSGCLPAEEVLMSMASVYDMVEVGGN